MVRPLLCQLKVEGRENIPLDCGAVVACNHNYGPDYVLLAYSSPRELYFMAKAEIFEWNPLLAAALRATGAFPVQRGKGDSAAIDTAVQLLTEGNLIAMFPEGTRSRSGKLMPGKTGAARIALAAGVPIVPVAVINSAAVFRRNGWRRTQVMVRFGEPITWQGDGDETEIARAFMDCVMGEIAMLLPHELRGEYGHLSRSKEGANQGVVLR
jgi:1-acyl-sn-glycerol-3-phosphate acyltransferase